MYKYVIIINFSRETNVKIWDRWVLYKKKTGKTNIKIIAEIIHEHTASCYDHQTRISRGDLLW